MNDREARTIVESREEGHMSALIERVDCPRRTWFQVKTRGKGGEWLHPPCDTLDGARARVALWFNSKG